MKTFHFSYIKLNNLLRDRKCLGKKIKGIKLYIPDFLNQ